MGYRLSKIYTKTGDQGDTGLAKGTRVAKDNPLIEAMGEVDELNSVVGLLRAQTEALKKNALLESIQHRLFDIGAEFSLENYQAMTAEHTTALEVEIDRLNEDLAPLKEFILPKGDVATCVCHLARSVSRRAERRVVTLLASATVNPHSLTFINRLSDYFFVLARTLSLQTALPEVMWDHKRGAV